jgi:hypothetical protein
MNGNNKLKNKKMNTQTTGSSTLSLRRVLPIFLLLLFLSACGGKEKAPDEQDEKVTEVE